ncbi:MAG: D-aminoacylase [Hyphomicrobiales bacterium]|nr:D-aminoacylase [Hyphomicrobiales bacterium]
MTKFDIVIRNGWVIDGTGAERFRADVAIADDRIIAVGEVDPTLWAREIDAAGLIVAPGFIDVHTHDDRALLSMPDMTPKVSQGVTSVVAGNCGVSLAPLALAEVPPPPLDLLGSEPGWFHFERFGQYVEALRESPPAVNYGLLVGHITLRHRVMDRFDRAARPSENAEMQRQVDAAMKEGAIGFSTGLDYPSAVAAPTEEILPLVAALKPHDGIYCSHHRNYFDRLEEAIDEALTIGRETQVPLTISHHQCTGAANFGKGPKTLAVIDKARQNQVVGLDAYPYDASSKTLDPGRAQPGVRIMVTWSTPFPDLAGRMLDEIAQGWGCSAAAAAERLLPAGAIYFQLDEDDVRAILAYEHTMIGSDGLPHDVHPHPRLWGTFPRVLGHYSRDCGLFSLEEAVRRMTSLPTRWFGFRDRGVLRPGAFADVAMFDPVTVNDKGSFTAPAQPAEGIALVMVNGNIVWQANRHTGMRPGRRLRREPGA